MNTKNVLALVTSASQSRIRGIARYAKSAGWNLMLENQLAHGPKGWNGDGVLVTMRIPPPSSATSTGFAGWASPS